MKVNIDSEASIDQRLPNAAHNPDMETEKLLNDRNYYMASMGKAARQTFEKVTKNDEDADLVEMYSNTLRTLLEGGSSYDISRSQLMADVALAAHYHDERSPVDLVRIGAEKILDELAKISGITNRLRLANSAYFVAELAQRVSDATASPTRSY
jgi:hypothetical protein